MRWLLAVMLVAACHDHDWLQYGWDDRRVVCSQPMDDIGKDPPWDRVDRELKEAAANKTVPLLHVHVPLETISIAALERILSQAEAHGLPFLTYADFDGPRRAGVALAFDDSAIDAWFELRDLFAMHAAHVTFYVTRYHNWTDAQKAKLEQLAAEGHDVEPHAVNHLNAKDYVAAHGVAAYVADEVVPSIQILTDAGFPATIFAFPFGASTDEINDAVLAHISRVRVGPGDCPY